MPGIILFFALIAGFAGTARAEEFTVGSWTGELKTTDSGDFDYCRMGAESEQSGFLNFAITGLKELVIVFEGGPVGKPTADELKSALLSAGEEEIFREIQVIGGTTLIAVMAYTPEFYDMIRRAGELTLKLGERQIRYDLSGDGPALDRLEKCFNDGYSRANIQAEQRIELHLWNIGMRGYERMRPEHRPALFKTAVEAWSSSKIIGGYYSVAITGADFDTAAAEWIAAVEGQCPRVLAAADIRNVDRPGKQAARRADVVCGFPGGAVYYSMILFDSNRTMDVFLHMGDAVDKAEAVQATDLMYKARDSGG